MKHIDRPFEMMNDENVIVRGNFVAFKQRTWQPAQQDFSEVWLAREVVWFDGTFAHDDDLMQFCKPIISKLQKKGGYLGAAEIRIGSRCCYYHILKNVSSEGGIERCEAIALLEQLHAQKGGVVTYTYKASN